MTHDLFFLFVLFFPSACFFHLIFFFFQGSDCFGVVDVNAISVTVLMQVK